MVLRSSVFDAFCYIPSVSYEWRERSSFVGKQRQKSSIVALRGSLISSPELSICVTQDIIAGEPDPHETFQSNNSPL